MLGLREQPRSIDTHHIMSGYPPPLKRHLGDDGIEMVSVAATAAAAAVRGPKYKRDPGNNTIPFGV